MIRLRALLAVTLLLACSRPPPASQEESGGGPAATPPDAQAAPTAEPTPAPAGAAETPPVDPAPAPAAPAGPLALPVSLARWTLAGAEAPLAPQGETLVEPGAQFRVELPVALTDARLALLDSGDALVAADESHEIGATWTRFSLVPQAPLRPGSAYTLRLDGAADREAHDAEGRAYEVKSWTVRVAGEPPPPEKPAKPARKRR